MRESGFDDVDEIVVTELLRGQIDRDAKIRKSAVVPRTRLAARFVSPSYLITHGLARNPAAPMARARKPSAIPEQRAWRS